MARVKTLFFYEKGTHKHSGAMTFNESEQPPYNRVPKGHYGSMTGPVSIDGAQCHPDAKKPIVRAAKKLFGKK